MNSPSAPLSVPYWDIHTHHLSTAREVHSLVNVDLCNSPEFYRQAEWISVGIHPWQADRMTPETERLRQLWEEDPRCIALGESGLDKRCEAAWELQEKVFRQMAERACEKNLPLLLHCVKASNEMIRIKRELQPNAAWIIHGFRGKRTLAEQLLAEGFYLSFGFRYQEEALLQVPVERLLLESDEESAPLANLYERVARLKEMTTAELARGVASNVNRLFFRL